MLLARDLLQLFAKLRSLPPGDIRDLGKRRYPITGITKDLPLPSIALLKPFAMLSRAARPALKAGSAAVARYVMMESST